MCSCGSGGCSVDYYAELEKARRADKVADYQRRLESMVQTLLYRNPDIPQKIDSMAYMDQIVYSAKYLIDQIDKTASDGR